MAGNFRLELGGEWDIADLENLVEALRISYSYYFFISVPVETVDQATRTLIIRHFWSQKWQLQQTAAELYRRIPPGSHLKLVSIHYASPGWIELSGYAGAISALAVAASRWVKTAGDGFDLFKRIQQYFDERKLSPPPATLNLDDFGAKDVDEARALCFEYGGALGLPNDRIEGIITLTGNPISALRFLTNLSAEARRLVRLQEAKKLTLPK